MLSRLAVNALTNTDMTEQARPFVSQWKQWPRLFGQTIAAPTALGGLLSGAMGQVLNLGSNRWIYGMLGGFLASIVYLLIKNRANERRDLLDRFQQMLKDEKDRHAQELSDLRTRQAAQLKEEQDSRHDYANNLNQANLTIMACMGAMMPGDVDRTAINTAITTYFSKTTNPMITRKVNIEVVNSAEVISE